MKDYLIGWQKFTTTFDGAAVEMELLPLKRGEFLRLLPILDGFYKLSSAVGSSTTDRPIESAEQIGDIVDRMESIIVGHVRNISGFTINGQHPAVEEVLSSAIFMPLVADVIFRLVEISKVGRGEEKNSDGQSTSPQ